MKQQQQQQLQEGGSQNPNALKNILEPLQNKPGGPRPTGIPGMGLLGIGKVTELMYITASSESENSVLVAQPQA